MGAAAVGAQAGATLLGAYGQIQQGKADSKYYKYMAAVSRENAKLAEASGKAEIYQLGSAEFQNMQQLESRKRETIGSQKAALATGAGMGSKTAEQIVSDTVNKTEMDEQVLRYNTDLRMKNTLLKSKTEAMNYEAQAGGYDVAAKNARSASKWNAASTILGGATSTAMAGRQFKMW